jgi:outer membrane protein TolC
MFRCHLVALMLAAGIEGGCGSTELSRAYKLDMPEMPPPPSTSSREPPSTTSVVLPPPPETVGGKPYPINLATALKLGDARNLDIELASRRLQTAGAQWQGARVLWLPNLLLGGDYNHHDGEIQNSEGTMEADNRQGLMIGGAPQAIFAFTEAMFSPLAARQTLRARRADVRTAVNNTLLAVAEAYFNVQQARGELAGAVDALRRAEDLLARLDKLAPDIVPYLEVHRARSDVARLRQARLQSEYHWRASSAELLRVLNLDPTVVVEPLEPPHLQVTLFALDKPVDGLIPVALTNRPELASQQALVRASLRLLQQEKARPFIPSLLLRGWSTPVTGTLGLGYFAGGLNDNVGGFHFREDYDIQLVWTLQNLGFGNRALIRQRAAENQAAFVEQLRIQVRVAEEVVQAYALAQTAAKRVREAEAQVKEAQATVEQALVGVSQPRRAGNLVQLIVRPLEVLAAVNALNQGYTDYYGAIGDFNRAQFELYRALGQPAQVLLNDPNCGAPTPPKPPSDAPPDSKPDTLPTPRKVASSNQGPNPKD